MKSFLTVVLLFAGSLLYASQTSSQSFVIKEKGTVTDLTPYLDALTKSDLDKYRYFDKRSVMKFENGMIVELLSANEMKALGLSVKTERVRTEDPKFDSGSVFKLAQNGVLVEVLTKTKYK
ncbi:MAG: hypothetical protein FD123_1857 [Bacteroidetes bacterium]|nr:MAG: hypothetical protein FD123_1857 [Bacteroidota bacterium]